MPYIPATRGGDLITSPDAKNAGPENCTQRWNIKRVQDKDVMRPGWTRWMREFPTSPNLITLIADAVRPDGTTAVIAATATTIYRWEGSAQFGQWYVVGTGFNQGVITPQRWEAYNLNGYLVMNNGYDLPVTYQIIDGSPGAQVTPIHEMREAGIVSVDSIWVWNGVLFLGRPTELTDTAFDGWMSGATPYGRPPASMLTTTPTRIIWSADPVRWKVSVSGAVANGSNVVTLAFASMSFKVGQKVMFIETEDITADSPDVITEIIPEATITNISGNLVTLDVAATSTASGMLIPMDYFSQLVGFDDTTADGQQIIRIWSLGERLIVFLTTSILTGAATGDAAQPFVFEIAYDGSESLSRRWLVHDINDKVLLYYGDNRWYSFDLVNRKPTLVKKLDYVRNLFYPMAPTHFIAHNETDKELWIVGASFNTTVVYDYENDVVSQIDSTFSAAAMVTNPILIGSESKSNKPRLFLHKSTGGPWSSYNGIYSQDSLFYYYVSSSPFGVVFTRDGQEYESVLQWGYWSPNDQKEVLLQSWRLVVAQPDSLQNYIVIIERMDHPNALPASNSPPGSRRLAIPEQHMTDIDERNRLSMHVQSPYFQEMITFTRPLQILGRDVGYRFVEQRTRGWR